MNNTLLLSKLTNIEQTKNYDSLKELISLVQAEIQDSQYNCSSNIAKRTRYALSYLKKTSTSRPVLQKCSYQEMNGTTYQVITNSYTAFFLKTYLPLPEVSKEESYPEVVRLVPQELEPYEMDINKILGLFKSKQLEEKIGIYPLTDWYGVAASNLKNIVDILGSTDLKVYISKYTRNKYPLFMFENSNGDQALLLPVKVYSKENK